MPAKLAVPAARAAEPVVLPDQMLDPVQAAAASERHPPAVQAAPQALAEEMVQLAVLTPVVQAVPQQAPVVLAAVVVVAVDSGAAAAVETMMVQAAVVGVQVSAIP